MKFSWPFARTKEVRCPDGTTRVVYNNIDHLFPLSVSDKRTSTATDIKLPETVDAKFSVEISNAIKGLVFSLDKNNNSLILEQRAAYSGFAANPCAKHDWYQRRLEDLTARRDRQERDEKLLAALMSLANSPKANTDQLIGLLTHFVDRLSPEESTFITIRAMDVSEQEAIEFSKGEDDGS